MEDAASPTPTQCPIVPLEVTVVVVSPTCPTHIGLGRSHANSIANLNATELITAAACSVGLASTCSGVIFRYASLHSMSVTSSTQLPPTSTAARQTDRCPAALKPLINFSYDKGLYFATKN